MSSVTLSGRGTLGDRQVYRLGYGAMQLAGPGVFGPPKDPEEAVRVLQAAVEAGINHIDTSDFYGPHVTNQLIRNYYNMVFYLLQASKSYHQKLVLFYLLIES